MNTPLLVRAEGVIMTFDEFMLSDIQIAEIASIIPPCEKCEHLSCELQREAEAECENVNSKSNV